MFEEDVRKLLSRHVEGEIVLEVPPDSQLGDLAFPCFNLAKKLKKGPVLIARELALKLKAKSPIASITATGPYVNFFLDKKLAAQSVLHTIRTNKENYGHTHEGLGKTVVLDYSSVNIAKPFGIGHLRSTVIGNSMRRLLQTAGYQVIGVNHLGDWGTQFGALITAYKLWGNEEKLKQEPIQYLVELYVRFHEEKEKDPKLEVEARRWFKKMEDGDSEALALWAKFKHVSLEEFKRVYEILGVEFESWDGESFYNDKIEALVEDVKSKGLAKVDEGALIIDLQEEKKGVLILEKSDGASTYAARDLAAIKYRIQTYHPEKIVYVVGNEQSLHFQQVFSVAKKIGLSAELLHTAFGLYLSPEGGKMATRKGKIVYLENVLKETIDLARKTIEQKNPELKAKEKVAHDVGVGAVIFGDLANDRLRDIVFDWEKILDFEGDTGPYVQYTHARACSVLRKSGLKDFAGKPELLVAPSEIAVVNLLDMYPAKVAEARAALKPHIIAQYLLQLCRAFNEFYHQCPVLTAAEGLKEARLLLVESLRQVLANGLGLLNIGALEEM